MLSPEGPVTPPGQPGKKKGNQRWLEGSYDLNPFCPADLSVAGFKSSRTPILSSLCSEAKPLAGKTLAFQNLMIG